MGVDPHRILAVQVARAIARGLDSQQPRHAMHCYMGKEPRTPKMWSPFSFDEPQRNRSSREEWLIVVIGEVIQEL